MPTRVQSQVPEEIALYRFPRTLEQAFGPSAYLHTPPAPHLKVTPRTLLKSAAFGLVLAALALSIKWLVR